MLLIVIFFLVTSFFDLNGMENKSPYPHSSPIPIGAPLSTSQCNSNGKSNEKTIQHTSWCVSKKAFSKHSPEDITFSPISPETSPSNSPPAGAAEAKSSLQDFENELRSLQTIGGLNSKGTFSSKEIQVAVSSAKSRLSPFGSQ